LFCIPECRLSSCEAKRANEGNNQEKAADKFGEMYNFGDTAGAGLVPALKKMTQPIKKVEHTRWRN
jgi:hypothetical protein